MGRDQTPAGPPKGFFRDAVGNKAVEPSEVRWSGGRCKYFIQMIHATNEA